jgi:hypothetical protein
MRGYGLDGSNPVFHYRGMLAKNGDALSKKYRETKSSRNHISI